MQKKWYVYCLELEDGCYFINRGNTRTLPKLIRRHMHGTGGWFTKLHPVISHQVLEEFPEGVTLSTVDRRVNDYVLDYADVHGCDNVRGGGYSQHSPNWPTDLQIQEQLTHITD